MFIAFIQNLNAWEITLIALVFLLLFGAKRLPDLAKGIGKSIREFKKATSEAEETFRSAMSEEEKREATTANKPIATAPVQTPPPTENPSPVVETPAPAPKPTDVDKSSPSV